MSETEKQRCYHGADAGHYKADECKTFWERTTTDPVAFYTLGVFIFTAVLGVSTVFLWDATRNLSEIAERDTRVLQRAYLSVVPFGVDLFKSADGRLSCDVGFHNTGNLPARRVRWFIDRKFSTDARDWNFPISDQEDKWAGNNIVAPGTIMRKGGPSINSYDLDAFKANNRDADKCWLYVWGKITYEDGFKNKRFTRFCHRYNLLGTQGWAIADTSARYHEYGNDTDEEEARAQGIVS